MPITGGYRIVSHFGQYNVAGLKGVTLDNKGINIMGGAGCKARAIYDGEVSAVLSYAGTVVVMLRHGAYISVYSNLSLGEREPWPACLHPSDPWHRRSRPHPPVPAPERAGEAQPRSVVGKIRLSGRLILRGSSDTCRTPGASHGGRYTHRRSGNGTTRQDRV